MEEVRFRSSIFSLYASFKDDTETCPSLYTRLVSPAIPHNMPSSSDTQKTHCFAFCSNLSLYRSRIRS